MTASTMRDDAGLWQELGAPHVVGQLVLGVLRALRDDEAMRRLAEHLDEALA